MHVCGPHKGRRPISEAEQGWIEKAREALRKQLTEKRHHRTTPDPLPMQQDDYTAFTGIDGIEDARRPEMGESQTDPRRSGRENRTRGYQPEQNTGDIGIQEVEKDDEGGGADTHTKPRRSFFTKSH